MVTVGTADSNPKKLNHEKPGAANGRNQNKSFSSSSSASFSRITGQIVEKDDDEEEENENWRRKTRF